MQIASLRNIQCFANPKNKRWYARSATKAFFSTANRGGELFKNLTRLYTLYI